VEFNPTSRKQDDGTVAFDFKIVGDMRKEVASE
jgi:hypothetical protein